MPALIQLVINGEIKQWFNPQYFNLEQIEIKEKTNGNLYNYFFQSEDYYYKWEQPEKGGKIELYEENNQIGRKLVKEINY